MTAIEEEELRRALDASVEEIIDAIALSVKTGYVVHPTKKVISKLHGRHEIMKMFDAYVSALTQQHEREKQAAVREAQLKEIPFITGMHRTAKSLLDDGSGDLVRVQDLEKRLSDWLNELARLQQQSNGGKV